MLRRTVGLLLAASSFVLNAERADVSCAKHAQVVVDMAGMDHSAHAQHSAPARKDCNGPAQKDCCEAVAACSIALGDLAPMTFVRERAPAARIPGIVQLEPASRIRAPEPPPPRG